MVYVLDYDTATGERAVTALPAEALDDALAAARRSSADLAVVRARLVEVATDSAVGAGRWVAVWADPVW